jgi:hypothetical protein
MAVDLRAFCLVLAFGVCSFSIFGTVVDHGVFYGGVCLLGPLLGPIAIVCWYRFAPFNPYNKLAQRFGSSFASPEHDPDCISLLEIFRSEAARRFIARRAAQLAGTLLVLSLVTLALFPVRIIWQVNIPSLIGGVFGCSAGALVFIGTELQYWGIKTWVAERQMKAHTST